MKDEIIIINGNKYNKAFIATWSFATFAGYWSVYGKGKPEAAAKKFGIKVPKKEV